MTENTTAKVVTLAEINEMTRYGTNMTAYQMLRSKGVHPVSFRRNPIQGGDIGEYDLDEVMEKMHSRISKVRSDAARRETDQK
jgi:hypothetical protein